MNDIFLFEIGNPKPHVTAKYICHFDGALKRLMDGFFEYDLDNGTISFYCNAEWKRTIYRMGIRSCDPWL